LDEYAPRTRFNGHDYTGGLKKLIWPYEYVIAPIPLGVTLNSQGVMINMEPKIPRIGAQTTSGIKVMAFEDSSAIAVKHIWYLFTSLDQSQYFTVIDGFVLKKLAFSQWMDAESVKIAKKNSDNTLKRISIPKEILIRRVANILGGSHP